MKPSHYLPRRDRLFLLSKRARKLSDEQALIAWHCLSDRLETLGSADLPRFEHLLSAVRDAILKARSSQSQQKIPASP